MWGMGRVWTERTRSQDLASDSLPLLHHCDCTYLLLDFNKRQLIGMELYY